MSEGMPRLALAKYLSKHIMGIACAHVKEAGRQAGGGRAERPTGRGCLVVTKLHPARNRQESKIKRFYGQY